MRIFYVIFFFLLLGVFAEAAEKEKSKNPIITPKILLEKTQKEPVVDGDSQDSAWGNVAEYSQKIENSEKILKIKSVIYQQKIYFLIIFNDETKSDLHKPWKFSQKESRYIIGKEREDVVSIQLLEKRKNISIADLWIWGACRTNLSGYADDRQLIYNNPFSKHLFRMTPVMKKSQVLEYYDSGKRCWESNYDYRIFHLKKRYSPTQPSGSRADVQAKGKYDEEKKQWTLEFSRKLKTGHKDDVDLETGRDYKIIFATTLIFIPLEKEKKYFILRIPQQVKAAE